MRKNQKCAADQRDGRGTKTSIIFYRVSMLSPNKPSRQWKTSERIKSSAWRVNEDSAVVGEAGILTVFCSVTTTHKRKWFYYQFFEVRLLCARPRSDPNWSDRLILNVKLQEYEWKRTEMDWSLSSLIDWFILKNSSLCGLRRWKQIPLKRFLSFPSRQKSQPTAITHIAVLTGFISTSSRQSKGHI